MVAYPGVHAPVAESKIASHRSRIGGYSDLEASRKFPDKHTTMKEKTNRCPKQRCTLRPHTSEMEADF